MRWAFHDARRGGVEEECAAMKVLTANELSEFRLIIENAHREGWVKADVSLAAEHAGSAVKVTATCGSKVVQKTYPCDARWTFRLLRDLACGTFRASIVSH